MNLLGCISCCSQGRYTCKGDVWAFAVTLWEILTFAREQPFEEFPDHRIVENATYFYEEDKRRVSARNNSSMSPSLSLSLPASFFALARIVSDVLNVMSTLST